jgi:sec-independent protein translocase protein TatA
MFENLSLAHIMMVLVIVLLLFGAKRIPEIAGSMGKGIREFKKNVQGGLNESTNAPPIEPTSLSKSREPGTGVDEEQGKEPKRLL